MSAIKSAEDGSSVTGTLRIEGVDLMMSQGLLELFGFKDSSNSTNARSWNQCFVKCSRRTQTTMARVACLPCNLVLERGEINVMTLENETTLHFGRIDQV
jgi:hypothetical protein